MERGIEETVAPVLAEDYDGEGNVTFFASPISSDAPNPNWAEEMAKVILHHGPTGLDVVAGSLGTTQLWKVDKVVAREDPEFFGRTDVLENFRVVPLGPSGFSEGPIEKVRYPLRVASIEGKWQRGLQVLGAFPPPVSRVSPETLSDVLYRYSNIALAEDLSNRTNTNGFKTLPYRGVRTNIEYLTDQEQDELHRLNDGLAEAVKAGNEAAVRQNIVNRGQSLHRPLRWVYQGPRFAERSSTGEEAVDLKWQRRVLPNANLLARGNGTRPMRELQKLDQRGITVDFVVPVFDTVSPIGQVVNFFGGNMEKAQARTRLVPIGAHPSFHTQPEAFMHGIRRR